MLELRESKARSFLIAGGQAWWGFIWNAVFVGYLAVAVVNLLLSASHIYDLNQEKHRKITFKMLNSRLQWTHVQDIHPQTLHFAAEVVCPVKN